jgi:hypothetical protein
MISGCDLAFSCIYKKYRYIVHFKSAWGCSQIFQGCVSFFDLEFEILLFIGKATCFARICGLHMRSAYAVCICCMSAPATVLGSSGAPWGPTRQRAWTTHSFHAHPFSTSFGGLSYIVALIWWQIDVLVYIILYICSKIRGCTTGIALSDTWSWFWKWDVSPPYPPCNRFEELMNGRSWHQTLWLDL